MMPRYPYFPESNESLEQSLYEREEDVTADDDFERMREDEREEEE